MFMIHDLLPVDMENIGQDICALKKEIRNHILSCDPLNCIENQSICSKIILQET